MRIFLRGGLEPGATVRYAGGPKVGRVDSIRLDPQNPARLDVVFTVQSDLPVKTDSNVKIMSMSPLGTITLRFTRQHASTESSERRRASLAKVCRLQRSDRTAQ